MKKMSLTMLAAIALSMAGSASFAAELPNYERNGLAISPVQIGLMGTAGVQEQAPVTTSAISPHQLSVLTPRPKLKAAAAAQAPAETSGLATH